MSEPSVYPFQLLDVRLYDANIKRFGPDNINESEGESKIRLAISNRINKKEDNLLSILLNIDIKGPIEKPPEFQLNFTIEGLFETQASLNEIDEKIWEEFADRSSITLLWPYAREYTHEFSLRMREELPLLPTLNRLQINSDEVEETVDDGKTTKEDT